MGGTSPKKDKTPEPSPGFRLDRFFPLLVLLVATADWFLFVPPSLPTSTSSRTEPYITSGDSTASNSTETHLSIAHRITNWAVGAIRNWCLPPNPPAPPSRDAPLPPVDKTINFPKVGGRAQLVPVSFTKTVSSAADSAKSTPFPWFAIFTLVSLWAFAGFSVWIWYLALLASMSAVFRYRESVRKSDAELPINADSSVMRSLSQQMRARARVIQIMSNTTVLLILMSITIGVYLFYMIGSIITQEQSLELRMVVSDAVRALQADEGRAEMVVSKLREMAKNPEDVQRLTPTESTDLVKQIKDSNKSFEDRMSKTIAAYNDRHTSERVLSTTVTRIGALALIGFLVQILISMYRYNTRLCAFYHAMADVTQHSNGTDLDQLERLAKIYTPNGVDFGKLPATPVGELFQAVAGVDKKVDKIIDKVT